LQSISRFSIRCSTLGATHVFTERGERRRQRMANVRLELPETQVVALVRQLSPEAKQAVVQMLVSASATSASTS
jgi:hypothetical protein